MKVGIVIDGVLCDFQRHYDDWVARLGPDRLLSDEGFWASLEPYEDVGVLQELDPSVDVYALAERPKALFLVTKAWLKNHCGLNLKPNRIIMQSVPRYDARLNGVKIVVSSNKSEVDNMEWEQVNPIKGIHFTGNMREVVEKINASVCN